MNVRGVAIHLVFFVSGASALIYQMVWVKQLGLVIGTTIHSIGVVTATFMAGLALGGLLLGKVADRVKRPLRVYAAVEIGIAAAALMTLLAQPALLQLSAALTRDASPTASLLGRAVLAMLVLIIPCTMIGGTLPLMVRAVIHALPQLGERVGLLYCVNTLGAATGVVLAGLVLIEQLGVRSTSLVALCANVVLGATAFFVDKYIPGAEEKPVGAAAPAPDGFDRSRVVIGGAFFVSGVAGLALEVLWTRLLVGFTNTSAGNFTLILALILVGLAAGGLIGARLADRVEGVAQLAGVVFSLTAVLVLVGAYQIDQFLSMPIVRGAGGPAIGPVLPIVGMVLPPAACQGALFPLLVKLLVRDVARVGRSTGFFYALNTMGTIVGALSASFIAIPLLGVSQSTVCVAWLLLVTGIALAWIVPGDARRTATRATLAACAVVAVALSLPLWNRFHETLRALALRDHPETHEVLYEESADATVMADLDERNGRTRLQINSSMVAFDSNETKIMAHLPLLATPEPKRALVICMGMGFTFRSALAWGIDVDVVEINEAVARFASAHRGGVPAPRPGSTGRVIVDDGRNYLLATSLRYDMITIDPLPPLWSLGSVNLQTREFVQLVHDRLTDTGVASLWVTSTHGGDFLMIARAFADVFPHVEVFQGWANAGYYLLGSDRPIVFSQAHIDERLADPAIRADLDELVPGFFTTEILAGMYATDGSGLRQLTQDVEVLTDDRPRLEYRLWRERAEPDVWQRPAWRVPTEARKPFPVIREPTQPAGP